MAVAKRTRSPEVVARKDGNCPLCEESIVKGETYVAKVDGCDMGWMHAQCAAAYIRHREELDELNREFDGTGSSAGEGDQ